VQEVLGLTHTRVAERGLALRSASAWFDPMPINQSFSVLTSDLRESLALDSVHAECSVYTRSPLDLFYNFPEVP
jgi:hypothetical protein